GAQLFDRHYESLARYFRNKASESACDDLVQSVFLACTEGREQFQERSSFRSYLFGVAHHQLHHHYRSRHRAPAAIDFQSVSASEPGLAVEMDWPLREEQRLLLQALRHIPVEYQEVLELHYWEQMDTAEIAEVVGIPPGTVKSRLRRGRQLLEEQL